MPELIPLPDGFQCLILPDSDVNTDDGLLLGGTLIRVPYGFGAVAPDESGIPYSAVAVVHYPKGSPGPGGVTGVYIFAHDREQLRERAMEKVDEWRNMGRS